MARITARTPPRRTIKAQDPHTIHYRHKSAYRPGVAANVLIKGNVPLHEHRVHNTSGTYVDIFRIS